MTIRSDLKANLVAHTAISIAVILLLAFITLLLFRLEAKDLLQAVASIIGGAIGAAGAAWAVVWSFGAESRRLETAERERIRGKIAPAIYDARTFASSLDHAEKIVKLVVDGEFYGVNPLGWSAVDGIRLNGSDAGKTFAEVLREPLPPEITEAIIRCRDSIEPTIKAFNEVIAANRAQIAAEKSKRPHPFLTYPHDRVRKADEDDIEVRIIMALSAEFRQSCRDFLTTLAIAEGHFDALAAIGEEYGIPQTASRAVRSRHLTEDSDAAH